MDEEDKERREEKRRGGSREGKGQVRMKEDGRRWTKRVGEMNAKKRKGHRGGSEGETLGRWNKREDKRQGRQEREGGKKKKDEVGE